MSLARIGPSKWASSAPPTFAASLSQPAIGTAAARSAAYSRFEGAQWVGRCGRKSRRNETGGDEVILDVERRRLLHDLKAQIRYSAVLVKECRQAIVSFALDGIYERKREPRTRPAAIVRQRPDPAGLHDDVPVAAASIGGSVSDHVLRERNEIALVGEERESHARKHMRVPTEDRRRRKYRGLCGHLRLAQSQRSQKGRVRRGCMRTRCERAVGDDSARPCGRKQLGCADTLSGGGSRVHTGQRQRA